MSSRPGSSGVRRRRATDAPAAATGDRADGARGRNTKAVLRRRQPPAVFSRYHKLEGWAPNLVTASILLGVARMSSVASTGLADCDETFNYWEPLHYVVFGHGLQTWEYSPEFALRSYAFLAPFALAVNVAGGGGGGGPQADFNSRVVSFYAVRVLLALLSTVADLHLYDSAVWRFGKSKARLLLVFLAFAPGTFRASVELLPSSFAMISLSAATGSWMVGDFTRAVVLVAVSAILGWPFVAVLGAPIALHVMYRRGFRFLVAVAVAAGLSLVAVTVACDTYYYGKLTLSPLNLVMYNVFPVEGAGSEIYGVEDAKYYVLNLLLNLNVAAAGLCLYPLLWALHTAGVKVWADGTGALSRAIFLSPAWIWLLVFFNNPHKEERFLAPIYPMLLLIAAVSFDDILRAICRVPPPRPSPSTNGTASKASSPATAGTQASPPPPRANALSRAAFTALTSVLAVVFVALSVSRTVAVIRNYSAPFELFTQLSRHELQLGAGPRNADPTFYQGGTEVNICMGKEWHRFPTHFFLPGNRFRVRFTRSDFHGILPMYFNESEHGSRIVPQGMNMFNQENPAQYIEEPSASCHYFVDLQLPGDDPADNPIAEQNRLLLFREDFVDKDRSPALYRSFFIPGTSDDRVTKVPYVLIRNLEALPIVAAA